MRRWVSAIVAVGLLAVFARYVALPAWAFLKTPIELNKPMPPRPADR